MSESKAQKTMNRKINRKIQKLIINHKIQKLIDRATNLDVDLSEFLDKYVTPKLIAEDGSEVSFNFKKSHQIGRYFICTGLAGNELVGEVLCDRLMYITFNKMSIWEKSVLSRSYKRRVFSMSSDIKEEFTNRGFRRGNFTDALGEECSIQESSAATEERIWLGIDNPKLTAMSVHVPGLPPIEWVPDEGSTRTTGWSTAVLPEDAHIFGRMELNREMCGKLGRILTRFAETGELSFSEVTDIHMLH